MTGIYTYKYIFYGKQVLNTTISLVSRNRVEVHWIATNLLYLQTVQTIFSLAEAT